ncbi:hypothetical protein [Streptomyces longispororuber]|uniref:hypothetical protein n=1 Tax=Streptomyces longispororuber TaxID=68230 RepID=UPI00210A43A4|nr:hypothetical protein [Streptomyces longispororuber]MCQ4214710.1 hypothetical protein [Streptomyces longispororuber]
MRPVATAAVTLVALVLLAGCGQEQSELKPPRNAGEGAWYASSKDERREFCEAYRANDPQKPIHMPTYASSEDPMDFDEEFDDVLKEKC